jgi:hypothetical protein
MKKEPPFIKVIRSLSFDADRRSSLQEIVPDEWPPLLDRMDNSQITLPVGVRCRDFLPEAIRERIDRNLARNVQRHERLFEEYCFIAEKLQQDGVPFVMLKGLSHAAPRYVDDIRHRPQYDVDLYAPPQFLDPARKALSEAGFAAAIERSGPTDHLPPMIRNRHWRWHGDYYDPELPLTVEIHFRLWDPESEKIAVDYTEQFCERTEVISFRGVEIPVLSPADRVSYAALHLVRHLLRGDVRVYHVYELAHFLHHTCEDDELWMKWRSVQSERGLEAVAFRLASEWFGCRIHGVVEEAIRAMPRSVGRWFELFAFSPLAAGGPNKDELFLHLSLLENARDGYSVLARRLFPVPSYLHARHMGVRAGHHARTLLPLARSFLRWKYATP